MSIALDAVALSAGLRPLRRGAADRHLPLVRFLWWGTDPAVTTVVLLHTNRELLTGRSVAPGQQDRMRVLVGEQPGVVGPGGGAPTAALHPC
ncbi:hypothetical protein [Catenulispora sp. GP43]|uniref:hypothetical protein n=1 Tax=Catenulispora sp. GP43 TaxID=3156263 RepID=UPI0035131307